jgi:hypothetical protein
MNRQVKFKAARVGRAKPVSAETAGEEPVPFNNEVRASGSMRSPEQFARTIEARYPFRAIDSEAR